MLASLLIALSSLSANAWIIGGEGYPIAYQPLYFGGYQLAHSRNVDVSSRRINWITGSDLLHEKQITQAHMQEKLKNLIKSHGLSTAMAVNVIRHESHSLSLDESELRAHGTERGLMLARHKTQLTPHRVDRWMVWLFVNEDVRSMAGEISSDSFEIVENNGVATLKLLDASATKLTQHYQSLRGFEGAPPTFSKLRIKLIPLGSMQEKADAHENPPGTIMLENAAALELLNYQPTLWQRFCARILAD